MRVMCSILLGTRGKTDGETREFDSFFFLFQFLIYHPVLCTALCCTVLYGTVLCDHKSATQFSDSTTLYYTSQYCSRISYFYCTFSMKLCHWNIKFSFNLIVLIWYNWFFLFLMFYLIRNSWVSKCGF